MSDFGPCPFCGRRPQVRRSGLRSWISHRCRRGGPLVVTVGPVSGSRESTLERHWNLRFGQNVHITRPG